MTLKDSVQTAFLIVGFFTLLIFGASYYFVLSDANPTQQPLKDSLSITASFFGGFATLTAAYIASRLFNDWRDEQSYINKKNEVDKAILTIDSMNDALFVFHTDKLENPNATSKPFYNLYKIIVGLGIDPDIYELSLYTTNFTEPLSYQDSAFLKLPKFP